MNSNLNNEYIQYLQHRINVNHENLVKNEKRNNDDIIIRRHNSIAHICFRKTIYRSFSLFNENDEYNNNNISYIKYCIKIFLICLFIISIVSLIKFIIWH
ncbi:unnamed protein product [Rotaria sordida]|uniref:Uncharacterized protein n=1 Tax=Rotaria sordida TaxID=392033 RepID=A0A814NZN8_9BILA|nr:unnamed protein product [Rotaria sordida]